MLTLEFFGNDSTIHADLIGCALDYETQGIGRGDIYFHAAPSMLSSKARISAFFQAVVLSPNLTGLGYLPDLTPARKVDRPTGNSGSMPRLLSPMICQIRRYPKAMVNF